MTLLRSMRVRRLHLPSLGRYRLGRTTPSSKASTSHLRRSRTPMRKLRLPKSSSLPSTAPQRWRDLNRTTLRSLVVPPCHQCPKSHITSRSSPLPQRPSTKLHLVRVPSRTNHHHPQAQQTKSQVQPNDQTTRLQRHHHHQAQTCHNARTSRQSLPKHIRHNLAVEVLQSIRHPPAPQAMESKIALAATIVLPNARSHHSITMSMPPSTKSCRMALPAPS
jgi:hypothetical protein